MYVTKHLSCCKKSPDFLSAPPPEGPNSGYLVIQDDEPIRPSCFCGSTSVTINNLPLPSNKIINFDFTNDNDRIIAVPIINYPLSSNRYYIIKAHRKHTGEAYVCSKEEDKGISCGKSYIQDVKPRALDPEDKYQQFEVDYSTEISCTKKNNGFIVKPVVADGHVPQFLNSLSPMKIKGSTVNSIDIVLEEANGVNSSLRNGLPSFDFNLSRGTSEPICVGKWYCPFMFIHDGKLKDQMKNSLYYEMTLEQRWERIFTADSSYNHLGNKVMIDVAVALQDVAIGGKVAVVSEDENISDSKVVWFRTIGSVGEQRQSSVVGLSKMIVERMIWEQERVGWMNGKERQVRVVKEEDYGGIGWWVRFGCYVLVERFVLKRMDGSVVLTYDFRHIHQLKTKWE
ncbi:Larvicidal toxin 51 kDa protein [Bienertia sinuspersici]